MKTFLIILLLCTASWNIFAQESSASIKKQMAKIRQSTNWEDPTAAKKANEQLKELSKQLMKANSQSNSTSQNSPEEKDIKENNDESKMELWDEILKSASLGKTADVLLARPLRNKIVEEYKDDELPKNKNAEYYDEINTLCIDMSDPNVQQTINEMEKYKSILTLIITGGKFGAPVDLKLLLTKAAHYPLKELYIINFGKFVTSVPEEINGFKNLIVLSLINNKISKLPDAVKSLTNLKTLYVDLNPIKVIINDITPLSDLERLGVVKTKISKQEIAKIKSLLPNCKIEPI